MLWCVVVVGAMGYNIQPHNPVYAATAAGGPPFGQQPGGGTANLGAFGEQVGPGAEPCVVQCLSGAAAASDYQS